MTTRQTAKYVTHRYPDSQTVEVLYRLSRCGHHRIWCQPALTGVPGTRRLRCVDPRCSGRVEVCPSCGEHECRGDTTQDFRCPAELRRQQYGR